MELEIKESDVENHLEYEKELKRLGWCLSCQGYGQDMSNGDDCSDCKGTGKILNI